MSSAPLPAGITCTTPKLNSVTTSRNLEWKPEATANSLSTIDPATGIGVSMVLTPEDVSDTNLHFGSSMVTSNVQPTWRSPDTKMSARRPVDAIDPDARGRPLSVAVPGRAWRTPATTDRAPRRWWRKGAVAELSQTRHNHPIEESR